MAVGKNITWGKNGKGKQYHLPYNIEAVGKNITRGKRGHKFRGRKSSFEKNGGGAGKITSFIKLYTALRLPS